MLEKYLNPKYPEYGLKYEFQECHYPDATALILEAFLGFCGCGRPTDVLNFMLLALEHIEDKGYDRNDKDWYKKWDAKRKEIYGSTDGMEYFFWYWLHKEDFTTHGGSVPGWLEDKGKGLLEMLREWKGMQEDDK